MAILFKSRPKNPGGFREFLVIAFPLVISNASITMMHFIDRLMLSWSSPEEIAACIPAGIFAWMLLALFIGISEYTNTFIAQFFGAKRYFSIGAATWQGIFFSLICGIASLSLLPLGIKIFDWIGHPADIIQYEKAYYAIIFSGGTFIILKESLSSFYSGRGKTLVVMTVNILANIFNAVLDYALIFGAWGFPCMGIRGAALATVISTVITCIIFFVLFLSPRNAHRYNTRKMRFNWTLMKRMIRFGAPSGIHFFLEVSAFTAFVFIIGNIGKLELAASNIALALNSLAWLPMLGAGMATATIVGQYIGKKDIKTAEKSAYTAVITVEIYMIFFAIVYICFPTMLLSLFQGDSVNIDVPFSEIQRYGRIILLLVAVYQISDAMNITFSGALRGAGDTRFAMWANIVFAWLLFIPGTLITVLYLKQGLIGAWCWATAYISMLGVAYLIRFRLGHWKRIKLISNHE